MTMNNARAHVRLPFRERREWIPQSTARSWRVQSRRVGKPVSCHATIHIGARVHAVCKTVVGVMLSLEVGGEKAVGISSLAVTISATVGKSAVLL